MREDENDRKQFNIFFISFKSFKLKIICYNFNNKFKIIRIMELFETWRTEDLNRETFRFQRNVRTMNRLNIGNNRMVEDLNSGTFVY